MLDRLDFGDDGWPLRATPSRRAPFPPSGERGGPPWRPVLSDDFDGPGLEGVSSGVLGRKWLFKQEDPHLWSLSASPGALRLSANCVGLSSPAPANLLLQRPTSAYFSLEAKLTWVGPCDASGGSGGGGILARELTSGAGVALGLSCRPEAAAGPSPPSLHLDVVQDGRNRVYSTPFNASGGSPTVLLRLDVDLVRAQAWWRKTEAAPWEWLAPGSVFSDAQYAFGYESTRMAWEAVHGPRGEWRNENVFTTLYPGLWAGDGSDAASFVDFEYFRFADNERFAGQVQVEVDPT